MTKKIVKPSEKTYSLEEVRKLLQQQKEQTIFTLGLSSKSFRYPEDFDKMEKWMLDCPLVL